jgi:hypothetical protein
LVFQAHGLLGRGDLPVREFPSPFAYDGAQRPTRHEQVDEVAAECVGRPAQRA